MEERVDAEGTYVFLITKAYDSKFAPRDHWIVKSNYKRHIGIVAKVVAPVDSLQLGKTIFIKLYITDKAASLTKGAFERMGVSIAPEVGLDDPLSVGDLIDRHFRGVVTTKMNDQDEPVVTKMGKHIYEVTPKNIESPPRDYEVIPIELTVDNENLSSVEFFKKTKKSFEPSESSSDDEEIPF